jgi:hypothetical protein
MIFSQFPYVYMKCYASGYVKKLIRHTKEEFCLYERNVNNP